MRTVSQIPPATLSGFDFLFRTRPRALWQQTPPEPVLILQTTHVYPDSKVHGANMGPIWGWQDPGGPHVVPVNLAIWVWHCACTVIIGLLVNFLSPDRCANVFLCVILRYILMNNIFGIYYLNIASRWMPRDLIDDKSTFVWCHQAPSHYMNLCWPIFLPPYCITGPQSVNTILFWHWIMGLDLSNINTHHKWSFH